MTKLNLQKIIIFNVINNTVDLKNFSTNQILIVLRILVNSIVFLLLKLEPYRPKQSTHSKISCAKHRIAP